MIQYFVKDSDKDTLFSYDMDLHIIYIDNINLDDDNFDNKFDCYSCQIYDVVKKDISKELMPVTWHSARLCNQCISEDGNKEIEPYLIDQKQYEIKIMARVIGSY